MSTKYTLVYFDVRGLAEPIRMLFHYAGEKFVDKRLLLDDAQQLEDYKRLSLNHHIPLLEIEESDGTQKLLCESFAIGEYLAKKFGLSGPLEWDEAKIHEIGHIFRDFSMEIRDYFRSFLPIYGIEKKRDELRREQFDPALDRYMPVFSRVLRASASGYMVACGLTWVDFYIAEALSALLIVQPSALDGWPELDEYCHRVLDHPNLRDYVEKRVPSSV